MYLAIFEFLGTSELLVILVVALIIFGPRRLPQLSRQLGKSLGEFKRASEDFKRTWEKEVEMEKFAEEGRMARAMLQDESPMIKEADEKGVAPPETAAGGQEPWIPAETVQPTVARTSGVQSGVQEAEHTPLAKTAQPETPTKRDWL
jgi:sec-independent protein translocase protein TatB